MNTYIYSKWKSGPPDSPYEFYSEIDAARWEVRKVEVFRNGRTGFAAAGKSANATRLAVVPIPLLNEISVQPEFETRSITAAEFEAVWKSATSR